MEQPAWRTSVGERNGGHDLLREKTRGAQGCFFLSPTGAFVVGAQARVSSRLRMQLGMHTYVRVCVRARWG